MKFSRTSAGLAFHFPSWLVLPHLHRAWSKEWEKNNINAWEVYHGIVCLFAFLNQWFDAESCSKIQRIDTEFNIDPPELLMVVNLEASLFVYEMSPLRERLMYALWATHMCGFSDHRFLSTWQILCTWRWQDAKIAQLYTLMTSPPVRRAGSTCH